ncbi:LAQU0S03e00694g1_1 [Lachancea quebecensis]|uniref:Proteasome assembly chaperone 2 n=1 Tax=Lachancea quebecensis TaxID=1654605 RepID=A0A0P1KWR5_9SACH|nr:LAQU0S03e00694g1_1 [Lachancea quebecensis]
MKTLLLPLVSTGNVPQLMTDLVLHSLDSEFEFVRELDSLYVYPFTGPIDYVEGSGSNLYRTNPEKTFTTPVELFFNPKLELYVIQQRSPILPHYENQFCKNVIAPLIGELNIGSLVVTDATDSFGEHISVASARRSPYSFGMCQVSQIDDLSGEFQQKLQLRDVTTTPVNETLFQFSSQSFQSGISTEQFIFKLCYHLLHTQKVLETLKEIRYFNIYVQEGDNSEDAVAACEQVPQVITGFPRIATLRTPVSWNGVYGARDAPSTFEEGLYI